MSYELRDLTASDADALRSFTCSVRPRPYEEAVEIQVREYLPHRVELGDIDAIGAWSDQDLCGVAAWEPHPEIADAWFVHLVAVESGHRRRGIGLQLKREAMTRAHAAGIRRLISVVHVDNDAMAELNAILGGRAHRDPADHQHQTWVVPVA